jgi:SAM-dependent methyltransferase
MLRRAQSKVTRQLILVRGDLRRLPFVDGTFQAALIVHILHLIEDWEGVLDELVRVIAPGGVLLLGGESGGRSILVDYYLQQARARNISTDNLGAAGLSQPLAYLKRPKADGSVRRVEWISGSNISWTRRVPVVETLAILQERAFTQMRNISPEAHQELLMSTRRYARRSFGTLDAVERIPGAFHLYGVWP